MQHYYRFISGIDFEGKSLYSLTAYEVYPYELTNNQLMLLTNDFAFKSAQDFEFTIRDMIDTNFPSLDMVSKEEMIDSYYSNTYCSYEEISREDYMAEVSGYAN